MVDKPLSKTEQDLSQAGARVSNVTWARYVQKRKFRVPRLVSYNSRYMAPSLAVCATRVPLTEPST